VELPRLPAREHPLAAHGVQRLSRLIDADDRHVVHIGQGDQQRHPARPGFGLVAHELIPGGAFGAVGADEGIDRVDDDEVGAEVFSGPHRRFQQVKHILYAEIAAILA